MNPEHSNIHAWIKHSCSYLLFLLLFAAYRNIPDLIKALKAKEVDIALVELNYALFAALELAQEGVEAEHIIAQVLQLLHACFLDRNLT